MSGVNKVILLGRTGADPEVTHLESGNVVARVSLATSESYKDRDTGERKEITDWHTLIFWGGLAGVVEKFVKKGDRIYVEGKLKTRSWEKDGIARYTTEVKVDTMEMLGSSSGSSRPPLPSEDAPQPQGNGNSQIDLNTPVPSDDLPF